MLLDGISATDLRSRLLARELSPEEVVQAFLEAVGDDELRAWASIDPERLARQAAALSALDDAARARLPLFGIPVGIKDNFDTADLPTAYGSSIYAGHRPAADAGAVAQLRAAGALVAGKTKCAEFAWMTPPDTLSPLDRSRTPGGSSNGSAAAVAAGFVPLATGTQTAGSIVRPGSYCAVLGFKPSFGRYDRSGVKMMSETLDTAGMLARTLEDLLLADDALASAAVSGAHGRDDSRAPRMAFAPTALWDRIEPDAQSAIASWVTDAQGTGVIVDELLDLPAYARLAEAQQTIQAYESARSLAPELRAVPEQLSDAIRAGLQAGAAIATPVYERARRDAEALGPAVVDAVGRYDAVVTPSTTGVPPVGIAFTGDPLFCRVWTLLGAPSVSLPLVWTVAGLPAGLQLVAAPGRDRELLTTAAAFERRLVRP